MPDVPVDWQAVLESINVAERKATRAFSELMYDPQADTRVLQLQTAASDAPEKTLARGRSFDVGSNKTPEKNDGNPANWCSSLAPMKPGRPAS